MTITIHQIPPSDFSAIVDPLSEILFQCVQTGASVGFIQPFSKHEAHHFWTEIIYPALKTGHRHLWAAKKGDQIVGTVQLDLPWAPNQVHRADVSKLLVHPGYRRLGIAGQLMAELLETAVKLERSLLTLDTRTGDTAEPLYLGLGFEVAGSIPNFCRAPDNDVLEATTYMYKIM
jgi:ribosomal protein S18 acetylase RimI-like enzyme